MRISKQISFLETTNTFVGQAGDVVQLNKQDKHNLIIGYVYSNSRLIAMVIPFKLSKYDWLSKIRIKLILIRYIFGL